MAAQPDVSISVLTSVVLCAWESPLTFLPDAMTHSLPKITFHSNQSLSAKRMESTSGISEGDLIRGTGYNFVGRGGGASQVGTVTREKYLQKTTRPLGLQEQ